MNSIQRLNIKVRKLIRDLPHGEENDMSIVSTFLEEMKGIMVGEKKDQMTLIKYLSPSDQKIINDLMEEIGNLIVDRWWQDNQKRGELMLKSLEFSKQDCLHTGRTTIRLRLAQAISPYIEYEI